MTAGKPISVRSKTHFTELVNSDAVIVTVIMFTATWCRPCQSCYPELNRLAQVYKDDVCFATVDVDQNEEIVQMCKVRAFPTWMFIYNGKQIDFSIGAGMDLVEDKLRYHLKDIKKKEKDEDLKKEATEEK